MMKIKKQSRNRYIDVRAREQQELDDEGDDDEDKNEKLPKITRGWVTIYVTRHPKSPFTMLSAMEQLSSKTNELRARYNNDDLSITFCGHSFGASLSVLAAFDLVENGVRDIPVTAFVLGCPQVGNKDFFIQCKRYPNLKFLHIRNTIDLFLRYRVKGESTCCAGKREQTRLEG